MFYNPILRADSYKASHFLQLHEGIEYLSSYIEARGGRFKVGVFFGLQAFIKEHLLTRVTQAHIDEARDVLSQHGEPFNEDGWTTILKEFDGRLPVEVWAVPEGSVLPVSNVLVQVRNTDPRFAWLPSYLETQMQRGVWYPTSVCTLSWHAKQVLAGWLAHTSDTPEAVAFMLHDFGGRGATCGEAAALGGMGHLVNFMGTDTLEALLGARRWYGEAMAGYSVVASEHSTMTARGRDGEAAVVEDIIDKCGGPGKILSVVGDSYDIYAFVRDIICGSLKDKILASGSKIVVRPDSGEPAEVLPAVIRILLDRYGATTNSKSYAVLHPQVGTLWGDGINLDSMDAICAALEAQKMAVSNTVFGMGGGLLQHVNRDTMKFAQKASSVSIGGEDIDVVKDPVTDPGKKSKAGRLALRDNGDGTVSTVRFADCPNDKNLLRPVFRDGELLVDEHFAAIRARSNDHRFAGVR